MRGNKYKGCIKKDTTLKSYFTIQMIQKNELHNTIEINKKKNTIRSWNYSIYRKGFEHIQRRDIKNTSKRILR